MSNGTVKWFDSVARYGQITPDAGGGDLYVRASNISADEAEILAGQRVAFERRVAGMGPEASSRRRLDRRHTRIGTTTPRYVHSSQRKESHGWQTEEAEPGDERTDTYEGADGEPEGEEAEEDLAR